MGNESWLTPDIKNSEIFPESFDAVRKDRASDAHGGVFIAFKRDLLCTETPELDTNCEIVWCKMNIIGCRTLYLGSFYRPPDKIDNDYLEEFNSSLSRIMSNGNAHVLIGGDFNCGDIEWSHMKVPQGVQKRQSQQQLLDIIGEHCLTQVVDIPTRNDKTLDLLFTNFPSPVNRVKGMPPIGKADHDIVYVEYDIKAKRLKQASRKIYLYKRADMVGLKDHMTQFKDAYLSEDHSHMSVNDMWVKFKTGFVEAVERFIPSKMTKTKYSVPWIDLTIKRLVKKRNKLYLRARKSKDPDVKIHYKRFRAHVQKVLRDAYWKYVSNIFTFENDSSDPYTPKPEKIKSFGHLSNLLKKTRVGSHHSEKTEFLRQIQRKKPIYVTGSFNQPSHVKATLTRPLKGLVRSPPWGT